MKNIVEKRDEGNFKNFVEGVTRKKGNRGAKPVSPVNPFFVNPKLRRFGGGTRGGGGR